MGIVLSRPERLRIRPDPSAHHLCSGASSFQRWRMSVAPVSVTPVVKTGRVSRPGRARRNLPPVRAYLTALPNYHSARFRRVAPANRTAADGRRLSDITYLPVTDCPTLHTTWIDIYKHQPVFSVPPKRFGRTSSGFLRSEVMRSFRVHLSFRKETQRFSLRTPG